MKKRLFTGLAVGIMAIAMVGCSGQKAAEPAKGEAEVTTQAEAATQAEEVAEDWYKTVLEDESTKAQYPYYALADINLDGTDELFLSTTEEGFIGDDQKACVMAYDNGEVKTLQEIGGAAGDYWVYGQSDATLAHFSRMAGEGHIVLYNLENGELKEIGTADYYGPHHYSEKDNAEDLYMVDGKEVSREEGEGYFEQYGSKDGAITFEKY